MDNKTKKIFWEPNNESIFCNPIIRWINYFALFVFGWFNLAFMLGYIETNIQMCKFALFIPIILGVGLSIALWVINKRINHTKFFLWDYTEREKSRRFTFNSFGVCGFFGIISTLIVFLNIYILWHAVKNDFDYFREWNHPFVIIINTISLMLFIVNLFRYIELYYPLFKDDVATAYKIQKKPEHWIEKGREIRNEDEHKEIFKRDFGIDID